ncbi:MAG: cytochrome c-type biogenesis protein CcmH, partial [Alphaproteobacteria bacterium]
MIRRIAAAALLALVLGGPAGAVLPDEILADPKLEARARELSLELRCLVCQNQSIHDSNAELARDLRLLVRERLVAGDTNEEALEYIRARYGDFVLLKPPVKSTTYLLWFGPAAFLALGALAVFVTVHRRRATSADAAAASPLDARER